MAPVDLGLAELAHGRPVEAVVVHVVALSSRLNHLLRVPRPVGREQSYLRRPQVPSQADSPPVSGRLLSLLWVLLIGCLLVLAKLRSLARSLVFLQTIINS